MRFAVLLPGLVTTREVVYRELPGEQWSFSGRIGIVGGHLFDLEYSSSDPGVVVVDGNPLSVQNGGVVVLEGSNAGMIKGVPLSLGEEQLEVIGDRVFLGR